MISSILIPTDFSELSTHALRYACDLARVYHADLHVLHVVSPAREASLAIDAGAAAGTGMPGVVVLESPLEVAARKLRESQAQIAALSGDLPLRPVAVVRTGVPWDQIVRYADEVGVDLIVIGSHARGVMKRILLGSTSKAVLEHVLQPVLMVPIAALPCDASTARNVDATATGVGA
ncbi:MAG: hypothetical protein CHACPFDD_04014 [Phycisphaerae bacterium]|nr:hypothetical protein [Phycisphaerae bacterium]